MSVSRFPVVHCAAASLLYLNACDAALGLSKFAIAHGVDGGTACVTNADCNTGDPDGGLQSDICVTSEQRCLPVLSTDCRTLIGPAADPHAFLIGSLLSEGASDYGRQASAQLAVEEIDAAGGIPAADGTMHPLALLSCDGTSDILRAASHLIVDVGVAAIIGPDSTQDSSALAIKLAIPHGTLLMSPSIQPGSTADLADDDLVWSMVADDGQRAPLMIDQINSLESSLRLRGNSEPKLAILFPQTAVGMSARVSIHGLNFAGQPLSDPNNLGHDVRIDGYDQDAADQSALIGQYVDFAPDIVVLLGAGESIAQLLAPLEAAWTRAVRPHYLLTDAAKLTTLASALSKRSDLAPRVRVVGVTPSANAQPVFAAFEDDYQKRFGPAVAGYADESSSYDATYAIAFALATQGIQPARGADVARGLRALTGGVQVAIGPSTLGQALQDSRAGRAPSTIGTLAPLVWDGSGSMNAGTLTSFCVALDQGALDFRAQGRRLDVASQTLQGGQADCDPVGGQTAVSVGGAPGPNDAGPNDDALPRSPNGEAPAPPLMAADAGGGSDAGTLADAAPATTQPAAPARSIPCGTQACSREKNEACCLAVLRTPAPADPSDFGCHVDVGPCAAIFRCASDAECNHGEVCCGASSEAQCLTATDCARKAGTRLGCESARDCEPGASCCAHFAASGVGYTGIDCTADCPITTGIKVCQSDADCATATASGICRNDIDIPPLKMCSPF